MRSANVESKADKSQCFLMFGLSFNLILTLGSLGFTCYSLHLLYSRVTTVEQNVLLRNPSDQILSRAIVEPTSSETHPCSSRIKKTFCDKRAADSRAIHCIYYILVWQQLNRMFYWEIRLIRFSVERLLNQLLPKHIHVAHELKRLSAIKELLIKDPDAANVEATALTRVV